MTQDQLLTAPLTYETERLTLRALRKSDAGLLALHCADERITRMIRGLAHPLPPGAAEQFIETSLGPNRTEDVWVMDGSKKQHAEVIGLITLSHMDRGQSEINFWVAHAFWGTGFASEAVEAILAANPLMDQRYFAEVFQDNPSSARVLTKSGFEYLGDAESFAVSRGATVPTWTYTYKFEAS